MTKFLVNIDLVQNQILNPVFQVLASDPSSPIEGQFWYNSTVDRFRYRGDGVTYTPLVSVTDDTGFDTAVQAVAVGGDVTGTVGNIQYGAGSIVNADISASAAIAFSKLASPTATFSFNNQILSNVATPVNPGDAANKAFVEAAVAGLSWKEAVRAATTANITLANEQTIDGVSVVDGDRVLVKNQTDAEDNGIYIVVDAGSWTRATDFDSEGDVLGAAVMVEEGSTNASSQWVLVTDAPITIGTTELDFVQFGGGATYSAGAGLSLAANEFSVFLGVGGGLEFDGSDAIIIDTSVVARHYAENVGDGSNTDFDVVHNFDTRDVVVNVYDLSTYETVICDVVRTDADTVNVAFSAAPANDAYRVVVVG